MHIQRQRGGKLSLGAQVDGRHGDDTKAFAGILIGPGHPGVLLSTPNHDLLVLGHPWCAHLGSRHPLCASSGSWPRSCHSEKSGVLSETCMATPFWLTISLMICKD